MMLLEEEEDVAGGGGAVPKRVERGAAEEEGTSMVMTGAARNGGLRLVICMRCSHLLHSLTCSTRPIFLSYPGSKKQN
jgi:hypothetical protein